MEDLARLQRTRKLRPVNPELKDPFHPPELGPHERGPYRRLVLPVHASSIQHQ